MGGHAACLAITNCLCTMCLDMARCSQHMPNFRAVTDLLLHPCRCLHFALIALYVLNTGGLVYKQHGMFCLGPVPLGAPKGAGGAYLGNKSINTSDNWPPAGSRYATSWVFLRDFRII